MKINKILLILVSCVITAVQAGAVTHEPLYIVNGTVRPAAEVDRIPPAEIESMETLPADEESIARYGAAASNGVIIITLHYDAPARFTADTLPFDHYIAARVRWTDTDPTARVVLRLRIAADGSVAVEEELESTDSRLKRRILKALAEAPHWEPATKNGRAVESHAILRIQLPKGRPMPRERELIIR